MITIAIPMIQFLSCLNFADLLPVRQTWENSGGKMFHRETYRQGEGYTSPEKAKKPVNRSTSLFTGFFLENQ